MCYLTCTTRCTTNKSTRQKDHRYRCVLRYGVLLSSLLHLFRVCILVFHLKKKHEEGQRLLHYLRQTNTSFSDVHMYMCKKSMDWVIEIKNMQSFFWVKNSAVLRNVWTFRVSKCVTDPGNYDCYTGYY